MNLFPRRRKGIAPGVAVLLAAGWTILCFPCVGLTDQQKITPRQLVKNLKTKAFSGEPIELRFEDAALAEILLRNLVDNAVRYSAGRGREVRIVVEDGAAPLLRVIDDGPGVSPQERARLGERFHRPEGTAETGSGLGLSIVRRIAEIYGATVTFDAPPGGRGLSATVRFPAVDA